MTPTEVYVNVRLQFELYDLQSIMNTCSTYFAKCFFPPLLHTSQIAHTLFKRCLHLIQSLVSTQSIQYLTVANTQVTVRWLRCVYSHCLETEGRSCGVVLRTEGEGQSVTSNSMSLFHVATAFTKGNMHYMTKSMWTRLVEHLISKSRALW
jgi:hypothetical protein